jgi:peptidoglycan/xylan/chitin deacetylase (PgdA/CDA1 family)
MLLWIAAAAMLATHASPPATRIAESSEVIHSARSGCHEIALTFDLCPVRHGSGFDASLVDELVARKIPATLFVSGRWITAHAEDVRRLLAVPFFEIETHGQRHTHLLGLDPTAQRREIEGPVDLLRSRYAHASLFFRPPYGEYDETTLGVARELGLRVVLWSAVSGDPDPRLSEADILAALAGRVHDGGVVLFHANGRGWHTRDVVRDLYESFADSKLRPVTLAEMMHGCRADR